jgi:hypothetical protein
LYFVRDRVFLVERWKNNDDLWRTALFYSDNAPDIRADPSASVSWTQITTPGMIA